MKYTTILTFAVCNNIGKGYFTYNMKHDEQMLPFRAIQQAKNETVSQNRWVEEEYLVLVNSLTTLN